MPVTSNRAPGWRAYAATIRTRHLALLAATPGGAADWPDLDPKGAPRAGRNTAVLDAGLQQVQPALLHRRALLILRLAASFGNAEALAARLSGPAALVLDGVPDDLLHDLVRLLPAALRPELRIARTAAERGQPGTVSLVAQSAAMGADVTFAGYGVKRQMELALDYSAPIIVVMPAGQSAEDWIGDGHLPAVSLHPLDGAILAAHIAGLFPDADAAALETRLPGDAFLSGLPVPDLLRALRAESADAVLRQLAAGRPERARQADREDPRGPDVAAMPADGMDPCDPTVTRPPRRKRDGIALAALAGLDEAKEAALGILADLRAWGAGALPWDDVSRGVLLAGPPGCGKTELARAITREPGIHLEAGSYAQWQAAGHMGKMLEAMRASFARAATKAPAVLFIDEIDAFGSRSGLRRSQNESYEEKVITGLLECLDGIDGREGVVVLAACNYPERIDPAITRAGRFDQIVPIRRPDAAALAVILRQHLEDELPDADLAKLAALAFGLTGADCAVAVRAARAGARRGRRPVTESDLCAALIPDHLALPPVMRRRTAIHEAGHAIVTTALGLGTVRALRIGPAGGETLSHWHPADLTAAEAQRRCIAHLAGRAAELLMLGDASGGAGGGPEADLTRATRLLLACELSFGLGDHGHLFVSAEPDPGMILTLPPATRASLQRRLDAAMTEAQEILTRHRPLLDALAQALELAGFLGEAEIRARLTDIRAARRPAGEVPPAPLTDADPTP